MKKVLSLLALIPALLFAQTAWNGTADSTWYTSNKSATTYTITTAEQLAGLAAVVNRGTNFEGKTIRLGANIVLNDTNAQGGWRNWNDATTGLKKWTSIGEIMDDRVFAGNFNGNGKVINGLYININSSKGNFAGLFGVSKGNISNLGLVGFYVACVTSGSCGSLVGSTYYETTTATITNSYAIGNVKNSHIAGGIVGDAYKVTVINSYFVGTVVSTNNKSVGGIIGMSPSGNKVTVTSSFYDVNLTGDITYLGTPKTTAEMKQKATYQGWDFENTWGIGTLNSGMPYLQGQTPVWQAHVEPIPDMSYTGSQIKPTPIVKLNGTEMRAGVDFDYVYGKNIDVGTGTVTIIGKSTSLWGEDREVTFTIKKAPSTDCKVTMSDFIASGTASKPVPSSPNGTYSTSQVTYSYKNQTNANDPETATVPANVGVYKVTATFPATANYEQCTASAMFIITEGDCTPKKIQVSWTKDSVFTYNKMVQAPVPSVSEPGVELLRSNAHSAAGIYKGQDAAYAIIKDDAQRCNYALTNNTKDYEIKKKDLKPYFKAPAALSNIESNKDTVWVPQTIFSDPDLLGQVLDNLLNYDGFAQDTITKEKDDASVLKNTPTINVIYATQPTAQKMLAKRVETTQTAVAVINTDGVSADNYALAKRSITIMEILDEDTGAKRVLCLRGNYCTELGEDVCTFINGEKVSSCSNIKRSCRIDTDLCIDNMYISECSSIGGTVITMSCTEYALPIKRPTLASNAFRVWQTASGTVNIDLGYAPTSPVAVQIYNLQGKLISSEQANTRFATIRLNSGNGIYIFKAGTRTVVKAIK